MIRYKCLVRSESGTLSLVVRDFDSAEMVYAELESEGYTVYSVSVADENDFNVTL